MWALVSDSQVQTRLYFFLPENLGLHPNHSHACVLTCGITSSLKGFKEREPEEQVHTKDLEQPTGTCDFSLTPKGGSPQRQGFTVHCCPPGPGTCLEYKGVS